MFLLFILKVKQQCNFFRLLFCFAFSVHLGAVEWAANTISDILTHCKVVMDHFFLNLISGRHSLYKNVFVVSNIISYIIYKYLIFALFWSSPTPGKKKNIHVSSAESSWLNVFVCCLVLAASSQLVNLSFQLKASGWR